MSVTLKGSTYTGKFVPVQTFGFATGQSLGASSLGSAMMIGNSNQSSALLASTDGKSALRCELRVVAAIGGNGVCVDKDNITYDMNIKTQ